MPRQILGQLFKLATWIDFEVVLLMDSSLTGFYCWKYDIAINLYLKLMLECARAENVFMEWQYFFWSIIEIVQ